jgi:hypothetical protein
MQGFTRVLFQLEYVHRMQRLINAAVKYFRKCREITRTKTAFEKEVFLVSAFKETDQNKKDF